MKIKKVVNNNVVCAFDEHGCEIFVVGTGVGFRQKSGHEIDPSKIDKVFTNVTDLGREFIRLAQEIPYEYIRVALDTYEEAKGLISKKINKRVSVAIADHLCFAVERKKKGYEFENTLLWEIKKFYPQEFSLGKKAIEELKKAVGVELSEDEAGFVALHLMNAQENIGSEKSTNPPPPEIIKNVLNIVKYTFDIELEENTISYERFITHLKFFVMRAIKKEYYDEGDMEIFANVKEKYHDAFVCAKRVQTYIEAALKTSVSDEELTYLTLHIQRVVSRSID